MASTHDPSPRNVARSIRRRRPNPRLIKINRNYSVEEIAGVLGAHKNTVRQWIKVGLETLDNRRPTLILGRELRRYLEARDASPQRPIPSAPVADGYRDRSPAPIASTASPT